ncbi:hypothetical protein NUSPORA_00860 [Nucleospora cyclopteri]
MDKINGKGKFNRLKSTRYYKKERLPEQIKPKRSAILNFKLHSKKKKHINNRISKRNTFNDEMITKPYYNYYWAVKMAREFYNPKLLEELNNIEYIINDDTTKYDQILNSKEICEKNEDCNQLIDENPIFKVSTIDKNTKSYQNIKLNNNYDYTSKLNTFYMNDNIVLNNNYNIINKKQNENMENKPIFCNNNVNNQIKSNNTAYEVVNNILFNKNEKEDKSESSTENYENIIKNKEKTSWENKIEKFSILTKEHKNILEQEFIVKNLKINKTNVKMVAKNRKIPYKRAYDYIIEKTKRNRGMVSDILYINFVNLAEINVEIEELLNEYEKERFIRKTT